MRHLFIVVLLLVGCSKPELFDPSDQFTVDGRHPQTEQLIKDELNGVGFIVTSTKWHVIEQNLYVKVAFITVNGSNSNWFQVVAKYDNKENFLNWE